MDYLDKVLRSIAWRDLLALVAFVLLMLLVMCSCRSSKSSQRSAYQAAGEMLRQSDARLSMGMLHDTLLVQDTIRVLQMGDTIRVEQTRWRTRVKKEKEYVYDTLSFLEVRWDTLRVESKSAAGSPSLRPWLRIVLPTALLLCVFGGYLYIRKL